MYKCTIVDTSMCRLLPPFVSAVITKVTTFYFNYAPWLFIIVVLAICFAPSMKSITYCNSATWNELVDISFSEMNTAI